MAHMKGGSYGGKSSSSGSMSKAYKEPGESEEKWSGNSSDGMDKPADSVGVKSGLNALENVEVKDAEGVTMNQRPVANKESAGPFTMGVC